MRPTSCGPAATAIIAARSNVLSGFGRKPSVRWFLATGEFTEADCLNLSLQGTLKFKKNSRSHGYPRFFSDPPFHPIARALMNRLLWLCSRVMVLWVYVGPGLVNRTAKSGYGPRDLKPCAGEKELILRSSEVEDDLSRSALI